MTDEHPEVRYERSDAELRWILIIGVAAMIAAAVLFVLLWWFFHRFREYQDTIKRSPFPLAVSPQETLPQEPRLEGLDRSARIETSGAYRQPAADEEALHSYGSTKEKGIIHIPIERAMQLLENKLPVRPQSAVAGGRDNGLVDAGESNSGRMLRRSPP